MKQFCVVLALALLPFQAVGATPDQIFAAGRRAFIAGDYEKAATLFEQALKTQPANANFHYWLGNAYGRMAQKANVFRQASLAKKTQAAFERAVALDPNHLDVRFGLLEYYMLAPGIMGGGEEKALQQAAEIKKRDPVLGHRAAARIFAIQKKPDLARKEYTDAIRENPASGKAHFYLASYLEGQKDYKGALGEYESAAELGYMHAFFRIGVVSVLSESNYARGEEALKKYLTHTPDENEAPIARGWYWLGRVQEKQGRKDDARASYSTSLKLAPGTKDVTEALKRVS